VATELDEASSGAYGGASGLLQSELRTRHNRRWPPPTCDLDGGPLLRVTSTAALSCAQPRWWLLLHATRAAAMGMDLGVAMASSQHGDGNAREYRHGLDLGRRA
jgi:hypothetical protein